MGRPRARKRDDLLDAAEAVIRRDGAARLTIDAVAVQAGVSKATVLYGFESKDKLIKTLIDRRIDEISAEIAAFRAEGRDEGAGDATIRAMLAMAGRGMTEEDRAVFLSLSAALAQQSELAGSIRAHYEQCAKDIGGESASPRGAFLAFLAIEGLFCLERFDILRLAPEDRARTLTDIARLAVEFPDESVMKGAA